MTKYRGYRAIFSRNTTGSTYVTIPALLELGEVGSTRAGIDVSAHGDEWVDELSGRQDGTEFDMRLAYDPNDTQHAALKTDFDAGLVKKFHLTHPDITGSTAGLEVNAVPRSWRATAPQDGAYTALTTWKIVSPGVTTFAVP